MSNSDDHAASDEAPADPGDQLIQWAQAKFGELTKAEEAMLKAAAAGEDADVSSSIEDENDLSKASTWPDDRSIRAQLLHWLCVDRSVSKQVDLWGVRIRGVRIDGRIDLESAIIPFGISLIRCAIPDGLNFRRAEIPWLTLGGTQMSGLNADELRVKNSISLSNGFEASGKVSLAGAAIGGQLKCSGGKFMNKDGYALCANRINVNGNVFLGDGFEAHGQVGLMDTTIGGQLSCRGGRFLNVNGVALTADSVQVMGSVFLNNGFEARGQVWLMGALIGGQLNCSDGKFLNKDGCALNADGVNVKGHLFLNNDFEACGEVRIEGAVIGGQLNCSYGKFLNEDGDALYADKVNVTGDVFLDHGFEAHSPVRLLGATIGGQLNCSGGKFLNGDGIALYADRVNVTGDVVLDNGFEARGDVRIEGAVIGGQLYCSDGKFLNKDGDALNADRVNVKGIVLLEDGFEAHGKVRFAGATIGGELSCRSGKFLNKDGYALNADRVNVNGDVILSDGFQAHSEVRFLGATIGGQLICSDGKFLKKNSYALNADRVNVTGDVFLDYGFEARGDVMLLNATISGNIYLDGTFSGLNLQGAQIGGALVVRGMMFSDYDYPTLDLTAATVDSIVDGEDSWPESLKNNLRLNGFQYKHFAGDAPTDSAFRIRWLELQESTPFHPQPYEQLAKVFREIGKIRSARDVLIAKEDAYHKHGDLRTWGKTRHWFLGFTLGYGYRMHRAAVFLMVFLLNGWALFALGASSKLLWPTDRSAIIDIDIDGKIFAETGQVREGYQSLNTFMYSLDTLVPIVDFHQQKYWLPNAEQGWGGMLLRWYLWVHIVAGWFFSTMLAIGLTGLARST